MYNRPQCARAGPRLIQGTGNVSPRVWHLSRGRPTSAVPASGSSLAEARSWVHGLGWCASASTWVRVPRQHVCTKATPGSHSLNGGTGLESDPVVMTLSKQSARLSDKLAEVRDAWLRDFGNVCLKQVYEDLVAEKARVDEIWLLERRAVVKPQGKLLTYLQGFTEEEQVEVYSKLAAAGFAEPGMEELVETLDKQALQMMGIEQPGLQARLLKAIALSGPSKTVTLVDPAGTVKKRTFLNRRDFELWAAGYTLTLPGQDGCKIFVGSWEMLEDGLEYHTTRTLEAWAL